LKTEATDLLDDKGQAPDEIRNEATVLKARRGGKWQEWPQGQAGQGGTIIESGIPE